MTDKLRICRVGSVPASIQLIRQQLIEIKDLDLEVTLICARKDEYAVTGITYEDLKLPPGIRYIEVDIPRNVSLRKDLLALVKLYFIFRRENFDVVHSISPKASLLVAVSAFLARVPVRIHTYTGQRWVTLRGLKRLGLKVFDWLVAKLNTAVFADSPSQAKFLEDEGISNSVEVIGSGSIGGVDMARFDKSQIFSNDLRSQLKIPSDSCVALFVGRLTPDKGVYELFQAFKKASQLNTKLQLLIVGNPEPLIDRKLPGLLEEMKNHPHITVVGYRDNLVDFMTISDFLVLPSYREGFGNVVIEAASCGLPCIGSNIYGLADAIIDGVTGRLVPPQNILALTEVLLEWSNNKDLVKQLGGNAENRVREHFDSRKVSGQLVEKYRALMG